MRELERSLRAVASPGDLILTVGAGDVYRIGEKMLCG
jgi:UDP-N-acetylmuramate--alanine ligase